MKRRDHWNFIKDPTKPVLTSDDDVIYWKMIIERIAKAGFEFEFNLNYKKNMCKGTEYSSHCDCLNSDQGCALVCIHKEKCENAKAKDICVNANSPVCTQECDECESFLLQCPELSCIDFASKCVVCEDFKVDCESCGKKYDPTYDVMQSRNNIATVLNPTNNWGVHGEEGIAEVTTDGSLEGGEGQEKGVEVTTVGKRIDFRNYYEMIRKITDVAFVNGAYVNERCSIHVHLLLDYYKKFNKKDKERGINTSELEKPVPQIVVANFWQLVRKYQNALTWMGMALADPKHYTRWEKFRISVLEFSPLFKTMADLKQEVMIHCENVGKPDYAFLNLDNMRFGSDGDARTFHVEFRHMDMIPSPSIVAASAILYFGMLMKAVELSRWGLLEIGDADGLKEARKLKEYILNHCPPGWDHESRLGKTQQVKKHANSYREQAVELVGLVKHTLTKFGPQPYEILRKLAETPVCFLREKGMEWSEIEEEFFVPFREEDDLDHCVMRLIDTNSVGDCANVDQWVDEAFDFLKERSIEKMPFTKKKFKRIVKGGIRDWNLQWADTIGSVIRS